MLKSFSRIFLGMRWPMNMEKYVSDVKAFLKEAGGGVRNVSVSKRAHLMLGSDTYKEVEFDSQSYNSQTKLEKKGTHVRRAQLSATVHYDSLDKVPFALDVDMDLVEHLMEPDDITVKADMGIKHGYDMKLDVRGRKVYIFGKEIGEGDDSGYDAECAKLQKMMKKHGFELAALQR